MSRGDAAGVGDLIQTAIAAGANDAGRLNFFVSDPGTAQARSAMAAGASVESGTEAITFAIDVVFALK